MAHEIDTTTGRAAIAYAGMTPWHGLGAQIDATAGMTEWQKAAGLDWYAKDAPVTFTNDAGVVQGVGDRKVLYRSDTGAALSVVSQKYQVVQPSDVVELFRDVCDAGGFEMETLGALRAGKRIWGLAKIGEGAAITKKGKMKDVVKPYLLMATSFDGSLPTIGQLTTVRVVCANTLRMSIGETGRAADIRLVHNARFDREAFRKRLGVFKSAWEKFEIEAGLLAGQGVTDEEACEFFRELLAPYVTGEGAKVKESRGYKNLMELFCGRNLIGAELAGQTKWGLLNAVTEHVDHRAGRSTDTRLNAAWFGAGGELKDRARELLLAS